MRLEAVEGAPAPGTLIGDKYRVNGVVGSGGMGCLVSAEHLLLKKPVAIKLVLANRSDSARRRLFQEARAAQALSCEQVVRVFDLGVHDGAPYIVMELLEGTDLAARVQAEGPLAVAEAVDCVLEAAVAVAEAHALGIIHRDIKPANLFCTRTATQSIVKVLDFGISKVPETDDVDCEKTAEDAVLGTPYYASPEQLRNPAKIDGRTDVWAMGVTLFHLLTGEHPFPGATPREVTAMIFTDAPREARDLRPDIPEGLCAAIASALVKRPEERTPTVAALVEAILPYASSRGRRAAERVAAMAPPPAAAPVRTVQAPSLPMTTTEEGLSSTLRGSPTLEPPPVPAPARRPVALALAALVATGAVVWLASGSAPEPLRRGSHAGAARPLSAPAAVQSTAVDEPARTAPAVEEAPPAETAPARPPSRRRDAAATAPPTAATAPPTAATAPPTAATAPPTAAPPPPDARDIDGVPIVE
jgi:serine/threonine-protein kinase